MFYMQAGKIKTLFNQRSKRNNAVTEEEKNALKQIRG